MSTAKGTAFVTVVASLPPAAVALAYLFEWTPITASSPPIKTACLLAYCLVLYKTAFEYFTNPLRGLPMAPDVTFLLGNAFQHISYPPGHKELEWMNDVPNDGIIGLSGIFHRNYWMILTTPETVMEVFNTNAYDWQKPSASRMILRKILGNGLVVTEGDEHKIQRKNVTPAFAGKTIKNLVPIFWEKSLALADLVDRTALSNGGWVDISTLPSRATLDIIGLAGLGKEMSCVSDTEHELAVQYSLLADPKHGSLTAYFVALALLPKWLVSIIPMKTKDRVEGAVVEVRRIVGELLLEKRHAMEEKTVEQKDIIATLMRSGKFTDSGLIDQLLTFLAAGHETTASGLTWTIYLLSINPGVQDRLRQECRSAFGSMDPDEVMTAEHVDGQEFLDAVCNESLRLFPPVPLTLRQTCRTTRLRDRIIPKGITAIIPAWAINRYKGFWGPDAEEFRPDRWLGPNGKNGGATSPYAFQSFIFGPRGCIGQSFARLELKCLLAALMLRHDFRLKDPSYVPVPEGEITIRPKDGMDVIVTPVAMNK